LNAQSARIALARSRADLTSVLSSFMTQSLSKLTCQPCAHPQLFRGTGVGDFLNQLLWFPVPCVQSSHGVQHYLATLFTAFKSIAATASSHLIQSQSVRVMPLENFKKDPLPVFGS
jgi:hypothetical protein